MSSLQDNLQKAGLVDKNTAKTDDKDKRKAKKVQHKSKEVHVSEAKAAAAQTQVEKADRDRALNDALKADAERKAITAQIIPLIQVNKQATGTGRDLIDHNFTDGKQIKKILISAEIQKDILRGRLAIVKLGDKYELVPTPVADKIKQRDESYVLTQVLSTQVETDEDDPYADYEIPDDLMW
jgi:uncharacterized protein YaiL (DUF2058 family)